MFKKVIATTALCLFSFSVSAIPITMQFTASGFGAGAPTDPVTGTIVWEAPSATSTITSLTSINMTIAGHSYSVGELAFQSPFSGSIDIIYGSINDTVVSSGTNDFWVRWDRGAGTGFDFAYASPGASAFLTRSFSAFSVTAASAVPEPAVLLLFGVGLAGIGFCRRKNS